MKKYPIALFESERKRIVFSELIWINNILFYLNFYFPFKIKIFGIKITLNLPKNVSEKISKFSTSLKTINVFKLAKQLKAII